MPVDTNTRNRRVKFPTTQWDLLALVNEENQDEGKKALSRLIELYWRASYNFLRQRGYKPEDAEDYVQGFFTKWIVEGGFSKAERKENMRFRTYLLASLQNFVKNIQRDKKRKKRYPSKGFVPLYKKITSSREVLIEPVEDESPQSIFNRTWAAEIITRVLGEVEIYCKNKNQEVHYLLLKKRILDPLLSGEAKPSLSRLAQEYQLTEKEASSRLITIRRICQRFLREEIRKYAGSDEEVAEEMRDIFIYLSD